MITKLKMAILPALVLALVSGTALSQEVTLKLWSQDKNGATGVLVEEFNASQDRIVVEFVEKDFSSLVSDATRAFATGNAPDILEIDNPEVAVFSSRGVLLNLTEMAANADHFDLGTMLPGPRSASSWEGQLYGIPKAANTIALYYNADMFRAAGLDPDSPPATWSELKEAAIALNDPANSVAGMSFSAAANEEGTFQFLPWIQMAGADYNTLDSDGAIMALAYWTDLYTSGVVIQDAISTGQWDLTGVFNAGGSAMHVSGPWELSRMSETAEFDWRVALLPTPDGSDLRSSALGEFAHVIAGSTEHPAEAFEFIDWFHSNEADMWNRFGLFPAFDGVDSNPTNFVDAFAVFSEQLKYAGVRGPHPKWPQISKAIQTAIQSALTEQRTPEEALTIAAASVQEALSE